MKKILAGGVAALLACSSISMASLATVNGDFEADGADYIDNPASWYDVSNGTAWQGVWLQNAVSPNGSYNVCIGSYEDGAIQSSASADVDVGNYLYQSMGTADGVTSLTINFDWGCPTDDPGSRELGISIGIYAYDGVGSFVPAVNTDVKDADGVSLLDASQQFTASSTAGGAIVSASATFDLSAAGSDELFLRINNYRPDNTESWTIVDNVQVVPEPATFGLLGVAGVALLFARRRFNK